MINYNKIFCGITACLLTTNIFAAGELSGKFSVSASVQVQFSQGNLQYCASSQTWRFASNQYDCIGTANSNISSSYSGYIDLFAWGTSGYVQKPYETSLSVSYGNGTQDIANTNYDWGVYNSISNGGSGWRTLTYSEWSYLLSSRSNASSKKGSATVNGVKGWVLLPDSWTLPSSCSFTSGCSNGYNTNSYTTAQWSQMQSAGAVFLPAAGYRYSSGGVSLTSYVGTMGYYWTSTASGSTTAASVEIGSNYCYATNSSSQRFNGYAVRLVKNSSGSGGSGTNQYYTITVGSNNTSWGTVSGGGTFRENVSTYITATPLSGYRFIQWNDGNTNARRYITVTADAHYTAQFGPQQYYVHIAYTEQEGTATGTGYYDKGTQVTLTATPKPCFKFEQWHDGNTDNPRTITVNSDVQYGAYFTGTCNFTITTLSADENMGTVSGGGTYLAGKSIRINATPKKGYKFVSWNDGNTSSSRWVNVYADATYTATFTTAELCTINAISDNESMGTVSGGGTYYEQELVTLTATPNSGYKFSKWHDGWTLPNQNITVTKDTTYTAYFDVATQYYINVVSENPDYGIVTGSGYYDEQRDITIEAIPNRCYQFRQWSDGSYENPRTIHVDQDTTYSAIFEENPISVTASIRSSSLDIINMEIEGTGTYCVGDTVVIIAPETNGYRVLTNSSTYPTQWHGDTLTFVIENDYHKNISINIYYKEVSIVASGYCGYPHLEDVKWELNNLNEFILTGTGATKYYSSYTNDLPWYSYIPQIKKVIVNEGVTILQSRYFLRCTNLTSVSLPSTLMDIGQNCFAECPKLTSIKMPNAMRSLDGAVFEQSGLTSIVLPDSLTQILQYTFRNTPLSEIILPEKLNYLYIGTFNQCEYLSKVYSLNTTAPVDVYGKTEISAFVFDYIAENATLYVPSGSKQNYIDVGYANYSTSTTTSAFTGEKVTLGKNFKNIEEFYSIEILDTQNGSVVATHNRFPLYGDTITLNIMPNENYVLNHISIKDTANNEIPLIDDSYFVLPASNVTISATFVQQHEIVVAPNNEKFGTTTGSGTYTANEQIIITATPFENYRFLQWNDGVTDNPRTIIVTQDSTFVAQFTLVQHAITVVPDNYEFGTTTGSGIYPANEQVTITAIPFENYQFLQWNDGIIDNPRTIIVTQDSTFVARFISAVALEDVANDHTLVYAHAGKIMIEYANNKTISIYTSIGQHICDLTNTENAEIIVPQGVYIVTVGNATHKVIVK